MKQIYMSISRLDLDYQNAMALATAVADEDKDVGMPVVVAWYDRKAARMSPDIAGADLHTRWHDYGASHGGRLEVDVGGDFAFVFADSTGYEPYGPSPYANLHDSDGNEYICQVNLLADPHRPTSEACVALDEWTSKLT